MSSSSMASMLRDLLSAEAGHRGNTFHWLEEDEESDQLEPSPESSSVQASMSFEPSTAEVEQITPTNSVLRSRDIAFSLKSTDSPIQRLPVELLHEIFLACFPPLKYTPASRKSGPLIVTWVCKSWRDIALSLTKLWSSLALEPRHDVFHCAYLSDARFWLARAGRRKLSLQIRNAAESKRPSTQDYTTFLTVEGYMQRCTSLELNVSLTSEQFLHILGYSFVLTEAKFSDVYVVGRDSEPSLVEVENLAVLQITTASVGPIFQRLILPQLRQLIFSDRASNPVSWIEPISLLERSNCRLEKFSYTTHSGSVVGGAITEFLQHRALDDLQCLVLHDFFISQHAIEALGPSTSRRQLLPNLTELGLSTCCSPDGELAVMLASRCPSPGTAPSKGHLKSLDVALDLGPHDADIAALNALILGGLPVNVDVQDQPDMDLF
ncbi:hypothetical protein C8F04DRAFT_1158562 [Mycena alexandri]|uniref:F-box domain-containing protein n=1 Tax=Mycena alexandri TaxID=1745969 RepID=A0AAD6RYK1_9AGAR|nr:hypothetical protein C8F04DRAFT_1158562 [Mycena alexandri]